MFFIRYRESFSDKDIKSMMLEEGRRTKSLYRDLSDEFSIKWCGRNYDSDKFDESDDINKALSYSHSILYSVCFSVILSMGYSPGIGFLHSGSMRDFVLDIADIYKSETTIKTSFESVHLVRGFNHNDIKSRVLKKMEEIKIFNLMEKSITEILWKDDYNDI